MLEFTQLTSTLVSDVRLRRVLQGNRELMMDIDRWTKAQAEYTRVLVYARMSDRRALHEPCGLNPNFLVARDQTLAFARREVTAVAHTTNRSLRRRDWPYWIMRATASLAPQH